MLIILARLVLCVPAMSSFDSIYKKMASLEPGAKHEPAKFDPARHISPVVAHESNNILTIVQGYADRLLLKHNADPALQPHLKLISEASRRAALIVREATPQRINPSVRQVAPIPPV